MKKILRGLGIILLVCGIVIYGIAAMAQKQTKGTTVRTGMIVNGQFVETDSGTIGSNPEGEKDMGFLKSIGMMSGVAGAVLTVGSLIVKKDEEPQY